ncbi:glycosyl transferase family A [Halorientalis sp. IM1011]|uniref:glucosyl-dolichyl phosphate glucuronosyltransferase n=1 Tax=Halorientalis sp. IM1011 TaxID=1932360 RepID=UPI00097CD239|nr:glucosyl-dolichyl phosphate glucuronosyltransferase [Halorientalis sp. IM1011]AQL41265.1 glycosyl transferase family A [Halorientalis sp. IM1011]
MRVSVVLCTHTLDRYDAFTEAAHSVLDQTHDDTELVLVSDGSETVYEQFQADFGDREDVRTHCNDENVGLLESRNNGAEVATGDVVAFIDDDAVADEDWVSQLVEAYEYRDALAAGGKMTPEWVAGRPAFLPAEFYFLVGVTQRGFADGPGEVRNTFGSNISFRRDVFLDLDGFDTDIGGRKGDENLQGGETELCARLRETHDAGVYYNPDARVAHKVFEYRTDPKWLLDRAFWQGYSKRGMEVLVPESTGEEYDFLGQLLGEFVPDRAKGLLTDPSRERALQFVMLFVFTAAVGLGYLYGATKWR